MRLNYLDILEQCFREKFKGYNKEEVDTFLHLVSDDFKEMAEEIESLKKTLERKDKTTGQKQVSEEITQLKKAIEQKDKTIEKLKSQVEENANTNSSIPHISPDYIKEKARKVVRIAREHAENHKKKTERELIVLKKEILTLTKEKSNLIENLKESARAHIKLNKK